MGLTDYGDIYLAIHETGINLLLKHVMRQRPSLVNFASSAFANNINLLCTPPRLDPAVTEQHNRLVTVLQLPSTLDLHTLPPNNPNLILPDLSRVPFPAIDFLVQVTDVGVDFYPGTMDLPADLGQLPPQMMAFHLSLSAGLRNTPPPTIPDAPLSCFGLTLYVVAGATAKTDGQGGVNVKPIPGGFELTGIGPIGLIDSINLLVNRFAKQPGNIPAAGYLVTQKGLLSVPSSGPNAGRVQVIPTLSTSPNLAHNPAIEDDEFKLWINVITKLQPGQIPLGESGTINVAGAVGGAAAPDALASQLFSEALAGETFSAAPVPAGALAVTTMGTPQPTYDWSGPIPDAPPGPDHLTVSVAGSWVDQQFDLVKNHFSFASIKHLEVDQAGAKILFDYDILLHLTSGKITRTDMGSIGLSDVDIAWDRMNLQLGLCIPQQCVNLPGLGQHCVFGGTPANPDIRIPLDLKNYLRSEIEVAGTPSIGYGKNKSRTPGLTDRQAVASGEANKWGVFVHPDKVHVEPIDVDDTVDNLIDQAVAAALAQVVANAPAWARPLLLGILFNSKYILETLVGLPDQINGWLSEKIGVDMNLITDLTTALAQHFLTFPLFALDDPTTIMPEDTSVNPPLIPVLVPLRDLKVKIDHQELTVQGKVGPIAT